MLRFLVSSLSVCLLGICLVGGWHAGQSIPLTAEKQCPIIRNCTCGCEDGHRCTCLEPVVLEEIEAEFIPPALRNGVDNKKLGGFQKADRKLWNGVRRGDCCGCDCQGK